MTDWIVSTPSRLDAFLTQQGAFVSRGQAQKAIERGQVAVNEEISKKSAQRVRAGDAIALRVIEKEVAISHITPRDLRLPILHEDDACIVIDKLAGIAVHPGAGILEAESTILHGAAFLLEERGLPFHPASVLVHRLDRETTGCLILAKTPDAHVLLQKQFAGRTVEKQYLALVAGVPSHSHAVIDAPIGRSTIDRTKMSIHGATGSRDSRTTYRTLSTSAESDVALLLCTLHTGRTHQIRVHLHSIGHPILGDETYITSESERVAADHGIASLCLHSFLLAFDSPADGKRKKVNAQLPNMFKEALKECGMRMTKLREKAMRL